MQVYSQGQAIDEAEFFDEARDAFSRGAEVMDSTPEADEVRVWKTGTKKRGIGQTRSSGATSKAKRKAQKKARRAKR